MGPGASAYIDCTYGQCGSSAQQFSNLDRHGPDVEAARIQGFMSAKPCVVSADGRRIGLDHVVGQIDDDVVTDNRVSRVIRKACAGPSVTFSTNTPSKSSSGSPSSRTPLAIIWWYCATLSLAREIAGSPSSEDMHRCYRARRKRLNREFRQLTYKSTKVDFTKLYFSCAYSNPFHANPGGVTAVRSLGKDASTASPLVD